MNTMIALVYRRLFVDFQDGRALELFRISFGILMMVYSASKCTDQEFRPDVLFYFDFRHRIPETLYNMTSTFPWYTNSILYWKFHCPLMLLCATGLAFGSNDISKVCCASFGWLKLILLLQDQSKYNNHEYLYSTLALALSFCECHTISLFQFTALESCSSYSKIGSGSSSSTSGGSSSSSSNIEAGTQKNANRSRFFNRIMVSSIIIAMVYLMLQNAVYGIAGRIAVQGMVFIWIPLSILIGGGQVSTSGSTLQPIKGWNILFLQVFIGAVYFYAGLAKCGSDWISGSTPRILLHGSPWLTASTPSSLSASKLSGSWMGERSGFLPGGGIGALLRSIVWSNEDTVVWVLMIGGLVLDLTAPFALIRFSSSASASASEKDNMYRELSSAIRSIYTGALLSFHLTNHFLFVIETFPWVMMASCALFHSTAWMDSMYQSSQSLIHYPLWTINWNNSSCDSVEYSLTPGQEQIKKDDNSPTITITISSILDTIVITSYDVWRLVLKPVAIMSLLISHLTIPLPCALASFQDHGVLSWGSLHYFFSWRMMSRSPVTLSASLRFYDPVGNRSQISTLDQLGYNLCSLKDSATSSNGRSTSSSDSDSGSSNKVCMDMVEFAMVVPHFEDRLWAIVDDVKHRATLTEPEKYETGNTDTSAGTSDATPPPKFPRVYGDVWLQINGPPIQRFLNPTVDIAAFDRSDLFWCKSENSKSSNTAQKMDPPPLQAEAYMADTYCEGSSCSAPSTAASAASVPSLWQSFSRLFASDDSIGFSTSCPLLMPRIEEFRTVAWQRRMLEREREERKAHAEYISSLLYHTKSYETVYDQSNNQNDQRKRRESKGEETISHSDAVRRMEMFTVLFIADVASEDSSRPLQPSPSPSPSPSLFSSSQTHSKKAVFFFAHPSKLVLLHGAAMVQTNRSSIMHPSLHSGQGGLVEAGEELHVHGFVHWTAVSQPALPLSVPSQRHVVLEEEGDRKRAEAGGGASDTADSLQAEVDGANDIKDTNDKIVNVNPCLWMAVLEHGKDSFGVRDNTAT